MDIRDVQVKIQGGQYEISLHAEKERYAEDISIADVEMALANGEILEDYPNDPRGESCLILGYAYGRPLHIVCGHTSIQSVRIITVYLPKPPKWVNERTRGRRGEA
jgi:hypothetical protein